MRTLKLLFLLLIVGVQANATGYAHNMFVAHQKLRIGKEYVVKVVPTKKTSSHTAEIRNVFIMSQFQSPVQQIAAKVSDIATLNERILDESPKFLFVDEQQKETEESLVAKLIAIVKNTVCAFAASLAVRG